MATFLLPGGEQRFAVRPGETVTAAARREGVFLDARCGGRGICKGCAVELLAGRVEWRGEAREVQGPLRVQGCRCSLMDDDVRIRVPRSSLVQALPLSSAEVVLPDAARGTPTVRRLPLPAGVSRTPEGLASALGVDAVTAVTADEGDPAVAVVAARRAAAGVRWECTGLLPDRAPPLLGLAVDVGTTTVTAALVDLESAAPLGHAAAYNRQLQCGDDVAARITWAATDGGRRELQALLVRDTLLPLARLLCEAASRETGEIRRVAASGNATMLHLLLGLDPQGMGSWPFRAQELAPDDVLATEVGLDFAPGALVTALPAAAPYLGGDALSGVVVAGLLEAASPALLIDLGTNAEIVLALPEVTGAPRLLACAAPAGPALEGMQLTGGGRAGPGAVLRVALADRSWQPRLEVVGAGRPVAVCGSGYIDFLAEGRRVGLLDPRGRLDLRRGPALPRLRAHSADRQGAAFVLAGAGETEDGEELQVTEADISALLQAKAAIRAGIDTLLGHAGIGADHLGRVYLAGAFAAGVSIRSLLACGLLPEVPEDRIAVLGNTALAGAIAALLDVETAGTLRAVAARTEVLELNYQPDFEARFAAALPLP